MQVCYAALRRSGLMYLASLPYPVRERGEVSMQGKKERVERDSFDGLRMAMAGVEGWVGDGDRAAEHGMRWHLA